MKYKYIVHLEIGYRKSLYEFTADDLAVNFMLTLLRNHLVPNGEEDEHYAVWMEIAPVADKNIYKVHDKNIYKEEVKYESEF